MSKVFIIMNTMFIFSIKILLPIKKKKKNIVPSIGLVVQFTWVPKSANVKLQSLFTIIFVN